MADRGCDADWFRDALKDKGITPCIPGRKSRGKPVKRNKRSYKRRIPKGRPLSHRPRHNGHALAMKPQRVLTLGELGVIGMSNIFHSYRVPLTKVMLHPDVAPHAPARQAVLRDAFELAMGQVITRTSRGKPRR